MCLSASLEEMQKKHADQVPLSQVKCYLTASCRVVPWLTWVVEKPRDFDLWLVRSLYEVSQCLQRNWEGRWWSIWRASFKMRRDTQFHWKREKKSDMITSLHESGAHIYSDWTHQTSCSPWLTKSSNVFIQSDTYDVWWCSWNNYYNLKILSKSTWSVGYDIVMLLKVY